MIDHRHASFWVKNSSPFEVKNFFTIITAVIKLNNSQNLDRTISSSELSRAGDMHSTLVFLFALLAVSVNAHFQLQYPPPRGVFDEDNEPTFCGTRSAIFSVVSTLFISH